MSSRVIVIIDYKMGNLSSVYNAFKFLNINVEISNNKTRIRDSHGLVLPGVGAFGDAMRSLQELDLVELIREQVSNGKPYLGICLGYQLLFEHGEEDKDIQGLNLLRGQVIKFRTRALKVPHIGWNQVNIMKESPMYRDIPLNTYFYFVHSYYPVPGDSSIIATQTEYDDVFASSINQDNIFATQFHPEKSQEKGLQLIKNFGEYCVNHSGN